MEEYRHFTLKEIKRIHNTFKYCEGTSERGQPCKHKASYLLESNQKWYCGLHNKPRRVRNSLYDRKGSFHYSASVSIHSCQQELDPIQIDFQDQCFYCKKSLSNEHTCIDHIESVIKDGKPNTKRINSCLNKVLCCTHCNTSKGNTDPVQWAIKRNLPERTIDDIRTRLDKIPTFCEEEVKTNLSKYQISKDLYDIIIFVCTSSDPGYVETLKNKLLTLVHEL